VEEYKDYKHYKESKKINVQQTKIKHEIERIRLSDNHLIKSESGILPLSFSAFNSENPVIDFYFYRLGKIIYLRWQSFNGIIPAQEVEYIESKQRLPYCSERQEFPIAIKQGSDHCLAILRLDYTLSIYFPKKSNKDQFLTIIGSTISWIDLS
jgi:hypothetical protein